MKIARPMTALLGQRPLQKLRPDFPVSQPPAPKFQGELSGLQRALNKFDFIEIGRTALRHSQFLYVALILARDIAAIKRGSANEVREHTLRDVLGATSWFYATPMLYPLFLKVASGKQYKDALIADTKPIEGKGLWASIRRLNQRFNPLAKWEVPTAEQLEERMVQTLRQVEKSVGGRETPAYKELESYFANLIKRRRYASGLGMVMTVLFLGFGIPLINIFTTRRNVLEGNTGAKGPHPLQRLLAPPQMPMTAPNPSPVPRQQWQPMPSPSTAFQGAPWEITGYANAH